MTVTEVTLETDGRQQAATLFRPADANGAAVVFAHGSGSSQESYSDYAMAIANEYGVTSLTFDLGGHGLSDGDPGDLTINDHLAEMHRAYDELLHQPDVVPDRIGACGASYGGYLAVKLTTEVPIKALLLRAPALYPDGMESVPRRDYNRGEIDTFRRELDSVPPNSALEAVAGFAGFVAVVRSEYDEIIPEVVIQAYLDAAKDRQDYTLSGAGHTLNPQQKHDFKAIVLAWAGFL